MHIRKRGKGWQCLVKIKGHQKSKTFRLKSDAQDWGREQEHNDFLPHHITLHTLIEKYISEVSPHHKGSKQEILRLRRIVKAFPDKPIAELKKDEFSDWKRDLLKTVQPGTVRRYMTAFNSVLNYAVVEWGYLQENPLKGVKKPSDAPHRERYPTDQEVKLILSALKYDGVVTTKQHEVAVSLLLALETAMRAGEILSICPENTDLKKRVVYLTQTKNTDQRQVPLSLVASDLIKSLPSEQFSIASQSHSTLFRKAVAKAGIKGLRFHDSRSAGLMRLSKKVDILTLARIVGHRDPRSLMIYYRERAEDIAQLLD